MQLPLLQHAVTGGGEPQRQAFHPSLRFHKDCVWKTNSSHKNIKAQSGDTVYYREINTENEIQFVTFLSQNSHDISDISFQKKEWENCQGSVNSRDQ